MGQLPHAPVIVAGAFSSAVTRCGEVMSMSGKAVISLTTGLEDPEKVTVAFLVAVAAAEQQRPTLMFLTKEAVRLASDGVAQGGGLRGLPAAAGPGQALPRGRGAAAGLPDLLQRPAPG